MPLTLPNLDDLRWEDLIEEGRALIPAYAPAWTNHNSSDPGITLMELLAYASERLMYQTNRISTQHMLAFLRLITGNQHKCELHELASLKRKVVLALAESTRAVTVEDFERLAKSVEGMSEGEKEGRAVCVPSSNMESDDKEMVGDMPGHVSVIVIPSNSVYPDRNLLTRVKGALEPARLLTTRIHVVGPRYVNLGVRMTLVLQRGISADAVRNQVVKRIKEFFDPLQGWIDKKGWPLGRNVYVSELYQLLGDIEGIELARRSRDAAGTVADEFIVTPHAPERMKRTSRGELEAIELRPSELVNVTVSRDDISISFQM